MIECVFFLLHFSLVAISSEESLHTFVHEKSHTGYCWIMLLSWLTNKLVLSHKFPWQHLKSANITFCAETKRLSDCGLCLVASLCLKNKKKDFLSKIHYIHSFSFFFLFFCWFVYAGRTWTSSSNSWQKLVWQTSKPAPWSLCIWWVQEPVEHFANYPKHRMTVFTSSTTLVKWWTPYTFSWSLSSSS